MEAKPSSKKRKSRAPTGRRTYRQSVGRKAEDIAVEFLRGQGLEILERNFRRRLGELDIVAQEGDTLAIVEVRTRASDQYGGAAASVGPHKQQKLVRAAAQLLQQRGSLAHLRARFDVIVVTDVWTERPQVQWLRQAFLT
jgi:putative endonuclease